MRFINKSESSEILVRTFTFWCNTNISQFCIKSSLKEFVQREYFFHNRWPDSYYSIWVGGGAKMLNYFVIPESYKHRNFS